MSFQKLCATIVCISSAHHQSCAIKLCLDKLLVQVICQSYTRKLRISEKHRNETLEIMESSGLSEPLAEILPAHWLGGPV
jgi:hypothetical protein